MAGQVVIYEFVVDDDVYYEDEVVGEEIDFSEEMNSDLRLTIYPHQRKLKTFRKSGKNQIVRQSAKIDNILDLSFDVEKTVKLANFENNHIEIDNETATLENSNVDGNSDKQDDENLTPLPNKYFASRGTGNAESVGFVAMAIFCEKCSFCFGTKNDFKKHCELHEITEDPLKLLPRTRTLCPIENCEVGADGMATLVEHVRISHDRPNLCFESIEFQNFEQFTKWKSEMERLTISKYIRTSSKKNVFSKSTYYRCNFSGTSCPIKLNEKRKRLSTKMGRTCTAFFHTKQKENGKVLLRGCLQHVGHDQDIRKIPISNEIRKEIATYLLEDLSEQEIVDLLRENSQPDDRRHYIQLYEVRNIHNKILKNRSNLDEYEIEIEKAEITTVPPYSAIEEVSTENPDESQFLPQATVDITNCKALKPCEFTKRKYDIDTGLPVTRGPNPKNIRKI
ncbi:unnamed protein product [Caenorhabditis angaria]|uniref:C2H2-type domain-containing protein n=1 Tax=Caenorhabditis angaria TaxID=860376 RepID=A0A9P1I5V7_9PELO|nr:unnamed protein product [Caenorhabditis angaria]